MKPARIKQITTEMVIAWGMICIGFAVYDNLFKGLNIIFVQTGNYVPAPGIAYIPHFLITISTAFTIICVSNIFCQLFPSQANPFLINASLVLLQFLLYWFVGMLLGIVFSRLFTKFHSSKEAEPHEEATAEGGQD